MYCTYQRYCVLTKVLGCVCFKLYSYVLNSSEKESKVEQTNTNQHPAATTPIPPSNESQKTRHICPEPGALTNNDPNF